MFNKVIILGAGGQAKVIADIVLSCNNILLGFLDDNQKESMFGYPVLGTIGDITKYMNDCTFIIGIGNNQQRKQIAEKYDVRWQTAIHPSAVIAHDVSIDTGTVIMARTVINPSSIIGKHCIINTGTILEHDSDIADYVHISPNSTLCGTVSVGTQTHIGAGVTVINNVKICPHVIVGAGAVVTNDINEKGTYVGVPAKRIK